MKNAAAASCPGLSTNLDNLRFEPSAGQLRQVEAAYEAGRMLEAWAAAQAIGPLARWAGPEARILAGRLAGNLGGQRLAQIYFWRAWRAHPGHPGAAAYRAQSILERLGPWRALEFLERVPEPGEETSAEIQIYLLTLRAMAFSAFRDFETASGFLDHARAIQPDNRWLAVVESGCLEKQDRYDEALVAARRSLAAPSYYRPGVQVTAHLYQVLDRDTEALGLLRQACARTECGQIAAQLAGLEIDLGLYAEAETHLAQFENLSPLADRTVRQWLRSRRMDMACRTGDVVRARVLVTEKPSPFPPGLEARLAEVEPPRRRVRLEVDFVRQHYLTCAPATLTALCRYWQQPAEHLELAEAICYDGTPGHSERTWAETHGFTVREFTVSWAVAVELIDRGLPFTLTTAEATSSHLQAVIGYEELRQALLLRDPYYYYTAEAFCPQFLERYAATGPRGMVPVPHAEAGRLAGLELPDASLYDQLHALNCALNEHRREAAAAILRALEAAAPDHRLVLTAGRCLAAYDANTAVLPRYIDRLLARFPRDAHLNLAKWGCLAEHAARAERLEFLEGVCRQPNADPVFYVKLAGELGQDARTEAAAFAAVREARRRRPVDAEVLLAP